MFQEYCAEKTIATIAEKGHEVVLLNCPMGVAGTDSWSSCDLAAHRQAGAGEFEGERGSVWSMPSPTASRTCTAKRFAIYGDPDMMLGMTRFLLELGAEPAHVLATNGGEDWAGQSAPAVRVVAVRRRGQGLPEARSWHMRSLLHTEPVDFLIGNTYGKYLSATAACRWSADGVPDLRPPPPPPLPDLGYDGAAMRVLVSLLDGLRDARRARSRRRRPTSFRHHPLTDARDGQHHFHVARDGEGT